MLASSGDRIPPCGVPVGVSRSSPSSVRIPAFRNALTRARTRLSFDPSTHPVHQGRVVDGVEARLDVRVQHPPVAPGAEQVDLGDRVLGPPPGPEPVGDRLEVGLEDRFQHQLQRRLHHPVGDGRDAQPAHLPAAAGFGDHAFPHRHRPEHAGLHLRAQIVQERPGRQRPRHRRPLRPSTPADLAPVLPATRCHATISVAGSCTRLNRSSNRRPGSAAAQRCSLVCISNTRANGRDEPLRPERRYSPAHLSALQSPSLLVTAAALRPCDRLSRPRTTTAAPPRPGPIGRRWTQPSAPRRRRGAAEDRDGSRVHCDSLDEGGARALPLRPRHGYPAALHRGLPTEPPIDPPRSSPPQPPHTVSRTGARRSRPISARFGAGSVLRDFETPVPRVLLSVTLAGPAPSGSTGTPRRCQGCFPPSPAPPGSGCPQLHRPAATGRRRWSLTSARINSASRRTGWNPNPRLNVGAACSFFECAVQKGGVEVHDDRIVDGGRMTRGVRTCQRPHPCPGHGPGHGPGSIYRREGLPRVGGSADTSRHRGSATDQEVAGSSPAERALSPQVVGSRKC